MAEFGAATAGVVGFRTPTEVAIAIGAPGYGPNSSGLVVIIPGYSRATFGGGGALPPREFVVIGGIAYRGNESCGLSIMGEPWDRFGDPIAVSHDLNSDGCVELMVSMVGANTNTDNVGGSVVIYGCGVSVTQQGILVPISALATETFTFRGGAALCNFGMTLDSPGDVDGDLVPDLLFSAHGATSELGQVFVVPATAATPGTLFTQDSWSGGAQGHFISGDIESRNAGSSRVVSSQWRYAKRDINGDGQPDFTIGTARSSTNRASFSDVCLIKGPVTPQMYSSLETTMEATDLIIESRLIGSRGTVISNAGDLNGDGLSDSFVVYNPLNVSAIQAWISVLWGDTRNLKLLVNADQDNLYCTRILLPYGVSVTDFALVDLNDDGYDDLVIAVTKSSNVIVVWGHAGRILNGWPMSLDVRARAFGSEVTYIRFSDTPRDQTTVASAHDFNQDGIEDLSIGDPSSSEVWIVYGDVSPIVNPNTEPIKLGSALTTTLPTTIITISSPQPLWMYMICVTSITNATISRRGSPENNTALCFTLADLTAGLIQLTRSASILIPSLCLHLDDGRLASPVACLRFGPGSMQPSPLPTLVLNFTAPHWNKTTQLLKELSDLFCIPENAINIAITPSSSIDVAVISVTFTADSGVSQATIQHAANQINQHALNTSIFGILTTAIGATLVTSSRPPSLMLSSNELDVGVLSDTTSIIIITISVLGGFVVGVGIISLAVLLIIRRVRSARQPQITIIRQTPQKDMPVIFMSSRDSQSRLSNVPIYSTDSNQHHLTPLTPQMSMLALQPISLCHDCGNNTIQLPP